MLPSVGTLSPSWLWSALMAGCRLQPPLRLGTLGVQTETAQFWSFVRHQEGPRKAVQDPVAYPEGCHPRCLASHTCSLLPLTAVGHARGQKAESGGGFLSLAWL